MRLRPSAVPFFLAPCLLTPYSLKAADNTAPLLTAPHATEKIYLAYEKEPAKDSYQLLFRISPTAGWIALQQDTTLLIDSNTALVFSDYKPMAVRLRVDVKEQPDANYDLSAFLAALGGFAGAVAPTFLIKEAPGLVVRLPHVPQETCPFTRITKGVQSLLTQGETTALIDDATLRAWQGTTGLNGTRATIDAIKATSEDLSKKSDDAQRSLDTIKRLYTELDESREPACQSTAPAAASLVTQATTAVADYRRRLQDFNDALDKLKTYLDTFNTASSWSGNEYTFRTLERTAQTQLSVTVTASGLMLVLGYRSLTLQDIAHSEASRKLVLRDYRPFPLEVGVATTYTFIHYPKFGTATLNGQTVVAVEEPSGNTAGAAVMLNALCRCGGQLFIFPGLQVGFGTGKDTPSILLGLSLRLISPTAVSLMAGHSWTWAKQLDTLKPGDPISGTAQLDDDLKLKPMPGAWYIGLQYSFGK